MTNHSEECCPRFDPEPWDDKEFVWENKNFIKDRVRSIFHMPLNFSAVMKKNIALIERADAKPAEMIVLSDENSPWGADIYIEATKDVLNAQMVTLSGTFLSKVFEGPYKNIGTWVKEMNAHVKSRGKTLKKLYFYYTTCPKCAKKYGKNYVVLLANV
jgi:hypothetical protein